MFNDGKKYFDLIEKAHEFQSLTESTKASSAMRTGIYMTHVKKDNDELSFKLLRCSSNFSGPSCNFADTDNEVIDKVNEMSNLYFSNPAGLNHVLAQIYKNRVETVENKKGTVVKQRKAKIKAHSDKTKDMPENAIMAFTTFYNFDSVKSNFSI